MGAERSTLPKFTMPFDLRWGDDKHLRCMKVNSGGRMPPPRRRYDSSASDQRHRPNPAHQRRTGRDGNGVGEGGPSCFEFVRGSQKSGGGRRFSYVDDGIAAVREKLMLDLQAATDRMRDAIFKEGAEEIEASVSPPASGCVSESPSVDCSKDLAPDAPGPDSGVSRTRAAGAEMSMRLRSGGVGNGQKRERAKFAVGLSEREVEEDFYGMVGRRPPRRPKKRARIVQKQIDTLLPGQWLREVTPDMYRVHEAAT